MAQVGVTYLTQGVKYVVEVDKNFTLGDFGNVVHGLARIIANPGVLIGEACQDGRDDVLKISRKLLLIGDGCE